MHVLVTSALVLHSGECSDWAAPFIDAAAAVRVG